MIWDTLAGFSTTIEILYLIPISIMIAVIIATIYGKLTLPIGVIGIGIGIMMAFFLAPYTAVVMQPLANTVWFGYQWTMLEVMALLHLISVFAICFVAIYNLYRSGGIKVWA